ncbi:MAG: Holliday junction resolvase RuvX [Gammaproteobacteria bacterium]|nr:Holliday junction resolvase RuvX [Gammaproteobacteria bacterium]
MSAHRTVLCFDYGCKRIGVAVGQELTRTARGLVTLSQTRQPPWDKIAALIRDWRPQILVVGLPVNMDGSEHSLMHTVRDFGEQLKTRYNLPVEWIDERLSSRAAEALLAEQVPSRHRAQHKQDIDKLAAAIILQTWLQQQPSAP